jgi:hypothetical protein
VNKFKESNQIKYKKTKWKEIIWERDEQGNWMRKNRTGEAERYKKACTNSELKRCG